MPQKLGKLYLALPEKSIFSVDENTKKWFNILRNRNNSVHL